MRAILLASLLLPTPLVWAQNEDNSDGFYLGVALGDFSTEIVTNGSGNTALVRDSDRDPLFSAGIGDTIAERVNLRAEYEVVEIDQLDDSHACWRTAARRF